MIRLFFSILFISVTLAASAQKIDTLGISMNKTVILIFEHPILNDDVGSGDVIMSREGSILKVKANTTYFKETNLFVETEDGYYSFILVYKENPKITTLNLTASKVTYEKVTRPAEPTTVQTGKEKEKKPLSMETENVYLKDCQTIASKPNTIHDLGVISTKVSFMLGDIYIKDDHLYFKVVIKNTSNIDYDIEMMRFKIKGKKGAVKQSAVQETELVPVYVFNGDVNEIRGKDGVVKVFVFKKFTFSEDKRLYIELWEDGGERILSFAVTSDQIINVKKIQ